MHTARHPLSFVLLRASGSFDEPVVIWQTVHDRLAGNWEPVPVTDVWALFREVGTIGQTDLGAVGQPRQYRWSLGLSMTTLERAARDRGNLHLVELTDAVHHLLTTYDWHVRTIGRDPYRGIRTRLLDVLGRLMMEVAGHDSLAWVLDGPPPNTLESTVAQTVRNLRHAQGLSQTELARHLKVSRSTVERWETGKTRPNPTQRERLAAVLGGVPSDYA